MPTLSITIPKATLQPGQRTIGPHSVPAAMHSFVLDVPTASQAIGVGNSLSLYLYRSFDGGATWETDPWCGAAWEGGFSFPLADGTTLHFEQAFWTGSPVSPSPDLSHPAFTVKIVITISGATVNIGANGSLVVS